VRQTDANRSSEYCSNDGNGLLEDLQRKRLRGDTWKAWRVFLAAVFALPMDAEALATYKKHTGRDDVPTDQVREVFAVVGRRGGKSAIAALIATYLSVFRDYREVLPPGETGVVMLIATDRRQARVLLMPRSCSRTSRKSVRDGSTNV
jgi:hypothetical protein